MIMGKKCVIAYNPMNVSVILAFVVSESMHKKIMSFLSDILQRELCKKSQKLMHS